MMIILLLACLISFLSGACPWSLLIGRWLLKKDIRNYGDGNPGAANVFRAGGRSIGVIALFLDVLKGTPGVFLAVNVFHFDDILTYIIGLSAILGHAFSPFLRFKGGKAVAVTYGVLLFLPYHEILILFAAGMFLGFLFLENDSWTVMLGPGAALTYLGVTRPLSWEINFYFVLCMLVVFTVKQFNDLQSVPGYRGKLLRWLFRK